MLVALSAIKTNYLELRYFGDIVNKVVYINLGKIWILLLYPKNCKIAISSTNQRFGDFCDIL